MLTLAAEVDPAVPFSILKPLLVLAVLIVWGMWVSRLDKDAEYYYLPRTALNALNIAAGALAFAVWLLIPFFLVGLLLALLLLVGAGVGYAMYRNQKVPPKQRWHLNADFFNDLLNKRRVAAAQRQSDLRFVAMGSRSSSQLLDVPGPDDPDHEPHMLIDQLLTDGIRRGAQRIDIGIGGKDVTLQVNIDGVNYKLPPVEPTQAMAALDYLKKNCAMDTEDRRRKQVAPVQFQLGDMGMHELRLSTAGSTRGVSGILELDPHKQMGIAFDKLGLLDNQVAQIKPVLAESEGLVIVATPPDQGRTTTLYALVQQHDPYLLDIHTIEQPIDLDIEGVTQHTPTDNDWAKSLNSILLRDPAVVMLSQVPDQATAEAACRGSLDQKRLYVGLRADDTLAALKLWAKAVGDLELVSASTRAVVSQRLIRKLCPACRQAYQPDPQALAKLNLPADKVRHLFKASGKITDGKHEEPCPTCHGLGYLGRTAAFEIMVLDGPAREHLKAGDLNALRAHVRKNKMLLMQEAALAKVMSGDTSISEVTRALSDPAKKPAGAGS